MDTLTEQVQTLPATLPQPGGVQAPRKDHLTRISPETAREMHRICAIRRQEKKDRAEQERLQLEQARLQAVSNPDTVKPDKFVSVSLARARKQLDSLYKQLDSPGSELTPAEIDKLASAIQKFSEIERNLAMRPSPGSLKPGEGSKAQTRAGWLLGGQDEAVPLNPNKTPHNSDPLPFVPGQAPEPGKAEQE